MKSLTVRAFILDGESRILLVHERGEEAEKKRTDGKRSKPSGWGLPGGGVDKTEEELVEQILKFLPVYRLSEEKFRAMPYNPEVGIEIFLTLIKECIEETGLLVCPKRILLKRETSSNYTVLIMQAEILDGEVSKRSIETDDCTWFPPDQLPEGTYQSHRQRISRALSELGVEAGIARTAEEEEMGGVL